MIYRTDTVFIAFPMGQSLTASGKTASEMVTVPPLTPMELLMWVNGKMATSTVMVF